MANYLVTFEFPQIRPEKCVGDYLQSKVETKRDFGDFVPQDVSRPDPSLNLVKQRNKLDEAEIELRDRRRIGIKQNEELQLQWENIESDTRDFRKTIVGFDGMIEENYEKRERLKKKISKQLNVNARQDNANESLQRKLHEFAKAKEEMEVQIEKHAIYEEFLEKVVEAHGDFKTWPDVLDKFEALNFARIALMKKIQNNIKDLEDLKSQLVQLNLQNNANLTGLSNKVVALHNRYKAAVEKAHEWEERVNRVQLVLRDKLIEIHQAKIACNNIYTLICARNKIKPEYPPIDFKNQLGYIKQHLLQLKKTLNVAKQRSVQKCNSEEVELPASMKQKKTKRHFK